MADKFLDKEGLAYFWEKIKAWVPFLSRKTQSIPFGQVDGTSTSTAFTATIDGIDELRDGVCCYLRNGVVTSASGYTININNLGAKPVYSSMAAASQSSTAFNINYTMLFVYNSTRVQNGCWDIFYGYYSDSNSVGYQLRLGGSTLPAKFKTYRYRLLFTSLDGSYFVGANSSSSTNATAVRIPTDEIIDPFGDIVYYGTTAAVNMGATFNASYLWQQHELTLGYSFNNDGGDLNLDYPAPVYLKCQPSRGGGVLIESKMPYTQSLPNTEDGYVYIFLGVALSKTTIELQMNHPVYYYKDDEIRAWTNQSAPDLSDYPLIVTVTNMTAIPSSTISSLRAGDIVLLFSRLSKTHYVVSFKDAVDCIMTHADSGSVISVNYRYSNSTWSYHSTTTTNIANKADKVSGAVNGHFAALDSTGNLTDSGHSPSEYLTQHQDISMKADKVSNATSGHFAGLDATGNLTDSGHYPSEYALDDFVVHKAGAETITGQKTFTQDVLLNDSELHFDTEDEDKHSVRMFIGDAQILEEGEDGVGLLKLDDSSWIGHDVIVRGVFTPQQYNDAVPKSYVDDSIENILGNWTYVDGVAGEFTIPPYSLLAFANITPISSSPLTMQLTPFTQTGGTSTKEPIVNTWFPIGCKIYYNDSADYGPPQQSNVYWKKLYLTHKSVDARYSAVMGSSVNLGSSLYSTVFLRVMVVDGFWAPYYVEGETNEIIVTSNQLISGNFYIYLGKTTRSSSYTFELEDNNDLYFYNGKMLMDWSFYTTDECHASIIHDLSNYYTKSETYSQQEVDALLNDMSNFEYVVITPPDTLPVASAFTMGKMYLYNGHRYVTILSGGVYSWHDLGSYDVDLSNYVQEEELENRPEFVQVTEEQMETMIHNQTWEAGILYYTVEED